jgi:hypothetical protein
MTKTKAPRHRGHDAKGAGGVVFGDRAHLTQNQTGSKSPRPRVAQGDRIVEVLAGPGQRLVPAPILNMLRKKFPRLIGAVIENGDDVYLLIADKKGRLRESVHYVADDDFLTAVRVAESGLDNLLMLIGPNGLRVTLHPPQDEEGAP